jgi:hypothetical protein
MREAEQRTQQMDNKDDRAHDNLNEGSPSHVKAQLPRPLDTARRRQPTYYDLQLWSWGSLLG